MNIRWKIINSPIPQFKPGDLLGPGCKISKDKMPLKNRSGKGGVGDVMGRYRSLLKFSKVKKGFIKLKY